METKFVKVLDSGRRGVVDLKRKRAARCEAYFTGAAREVSSQQTTLNSSIHRLGKQRKLKGSKSKRGCCVSHFKKSLLRYYSNFTRSGVPQRLMFYQNGEWSDFPRDFISLIKKDLQMKAAATEVEFNGHRFLLDFLHMTRLNLKTGLQQPIAWIDEAGKCFFPEIFSDDELRECCQHEFEKDKEDLLSEHHGYHDIRLQLDIEVNGSDCSKFKEYSGESNVLNKQIRVDEKPATDHCDVEVADSCVRASDPKVDEAFEVNQQIEKNLVTSIAGIHEDLDSDAVRKMFSVGMGSSGSADIVEIYRGSSTSMQARLELFHKQIEITNKYRGDANVRYAWLPSTKGALSSVMMYGLGHYGTSKIKSTYGIGVHLSPANCTNTSASYCDIDENGVRHMVFCRVIMGNMELVHAGSKQFHPSSEDFDSGVDDLQNPSHYIVWNINKNTHIYPEYVVSFKVSSNPKGLLVESENKLDISGVTSSQGPGVQLELDPSPAELGISCHQVPVERLQEKTANMGSTKVQVIRKTPQMKTVEKTEMVKRLTHEEKTTTVPRTKVITEERTSTTKHPVVKEVQKTRTIDVHRVVEEEKEITETVDVVEQVRERKVEKVPKVVYEEKETWITKPVVRQVEKKRTIKVPRVITEKKEEAYTDYQTEEVEEKKIEKVPRVVTEQVKQTMTVPVVTEVPVTKKVEVPTGEYCEEVVSHDHAPAALGPAVVPEKVTSISDTKLKTLEKDVDAPAEEPRRGLLGRLIGA